MALGFKNYCDEGGYETLPNTHKNLSINHIKLYTMPYMNFPFEG
jgi:hypothetical protein